MLMSSLCDYNDAYILVKVTKITTVGPADATDQKEIDERDKEVLFKNCAPFTDCIDKINNSLVGNAKDLVAVMPIYNLIEYSNSYSKTSGILW